MDLISSVSLSFQRDAAVGVPHILQLVPAPPTLSDTTRGNLLGEIRLFFFCAVFSPWSRSAADVPVLLYGGWLRASAEAALPRCSLSARSGCPRPRVFLVRWLCLGGSFTDCI